MDDKTAGLPPRFLRTPEAARFLGLSGRTMEKHRLYGTGPRYRKIGGRVVYAVEDLRNWADQGLRTPPPPIRAPAPCGRPARSTGKAVQWTGASATATARCNSTCSWRYPATWRCATSRT